VDRLLEAFQQTSDAKVGQALVAALKTSPAKSNLRVNKLRTCLAKYPPVVQKEAEGVYAALETTTAQQRAKLENLLAGLKGGDVRRGQLVFNNAKTACFSCHAIGYLGGKIGPDLTRIGQIRTERDLLESIVFPSSSFVRGYEPVSVTTTSGRLLNGLIRSDTSDGLVLVTGPDQEVHVARDDIEQILPSRVSIMPAGLDQQLTPQQLADLVAFLRACR
jgi:putative heme-binding domain-containing protein